MELPTYEELTILLQRERREKEEAYEKLENEKQIHLEFERELEQKIEEEKQIHLESERKLEERIHKLENNSKFLEELYQDGIKTELFFVKTVSEKTTHKSDHEEIYVHKSNRQFSILSNIDDYINYSDLNSIPSEFLNHCFQNKNQIHFADEDEIKIVVMKYINDIIKGSYLGIKTSNGSIRVNSEDGVMNKKGELKQNQRPDIWILFYLNHMCVATAEIKCPLNFTIFEDAHVVGQSYDYIMKQNSFYGQRFPFVIVTTLEGWKIFWLNDTDDCARSTKLIKNDFSEKWSRFTSTNTKNSNREICSSIIYKHTDPNLARIILSVIVKAYESPNRPVPMFSVSRTYIRLTESDWKWTNYTENDLENLNNKVTLDVKRNKKIGFTVLKYFKAGNYSKVRLAISDGGNIVILKEFLNDDKDINQELKCWRTINNINSVYLIDLVKNKTLVMPLVFNFHIDTQRKIISIPLDLKIWSVQDKVIPAELPLRLKNINNQILDYKNNNCYNLMEICQRAINKCAAAGYIHNDLELRHIALYPIIIDEYLKEMEPVMIDFEYMIPTEDYYEALNTMNERLDNILKTYENYTFE